MTHKHLLVLQCVPPLDFQQQGHENYSLYAWYPWFAHFEQLSVLKCVLLATAKPLTLPENNFF